MKTYRRRRQQYLFASLLGVIAIINLLFFLILYGPARSEYVRLQASIDKAQRDVQTRRQKIDRLEKLSAQLETSEQDRRQLLTKYFISKDTGWSEILPQLNEMIQRAGVKNSRKDYILADAPQYGLYSVKVTVPVAGFYSNVASLVREIENSDTFFIIESIDVRGDTADAELSMDLNLETFFYQ
jgi:Tfp pilus assembly protein PilO